MSAVSLPLLDRPARTEGVRASVGDIPAIEGLRGVAVLWVMVFHYRVLRDGRFDDAFVAAMKSWAPLDVLARHGYLGVDLFFVITGFLLTLPWFRQAAAGLPAPDARTFYRRRARRIIPAYYVQLVILFFVVLPLFYPRLWLESTPFAVGNLGAHFTFLHYTTPLSSASMTLNGALWTLAIEAQYYLLLPVIAPCFVRWPWRSLAAAFAIAAGWRWLAAAHLDGLVAWYVQLGSRAGVEEAHARHLLATQLPAWALHFALGILAGRAWLHRQKAPQIRQRAQRLRSSAPAPRLIAWLPSMLAAAAVLGLYAALSLGTAPLGNWGWVAFPLLIACALAAVIAGPSPALSTALAASPLAALGRISYSAYLYHLPLLLLLNKLAPEAHSGIAFPAWIVLVVAASALSYRYAEEPFLATPPRR